MATILFVHELGMGFGHLNRLLTIAAHLKHHHLIFGVPDPRFAGPAIEAKLGPSAKVMAVGEWRHTPVVEAPTAPGSSWTLADMLYEFGLGEPSRVERSASSWLSRLEAVRPDLIVADFAPMLRVAAADRIPTVVIGNGYTVPPSMAPLPDLRSDQRTPSQFSCAREQAVLSSVNQVREQLGQAPFQRLADLFQGDDTFAATFEIFDPYREFRTRAILPPFNIPHLPVGPAHSERTGPHVFCYLDSDYAGLNPLLTALNGLARPSQIFIRNLDPREVARHCAPQVGIHQGQADFRAILPQTRLLIHHANLGTASAGLLAGVPQLLLPFTLEQELTTASLAALDCAVGLLIDATADPKILRETIETLLASGRAQAAALAQGRRLQATHIHMPELAIVAACELRLAGHADG